MTNWRQVGSSKAYVQLDMSLKVVISVFEGLARLSRRVWRRFVRGSREISLVPSLHRASTDALMVQFFKVSKFSFLLKKNFLSLIHSFRVGGPGDTRRHCVHGGGVRQCCHPVDSGLHILLPRDICSTVWH